MQQRDDHFSDKNYSLRKILWVSRYNCDRAISTWNLPLLKNNLQTFYNNIYPESNENHKKRLSKVAKILTEYDMLPFQKVKKTAEGKISTMTKKDEMTSFRKLNLAYVILAKLQKEMNLI